MPKHSSLSNASRALPAARTLVALAIASAGAALPASSLAQTPAVSADWFVRIGAFRPAIDTQASADANNGVAGTRIDFERDLGLSDTETLPLVDVAWRFAPRHRLELNYLQLSRNSTTNITREITWRGQTYPIDTQVSGEFDSRLTALSYLYSFYRTPDTELSVGLGLHAVRLTAGVSAQGTSASVSAGGSSSATAPLPVVGLRGATKITGNVGAELRYQWFGIKVGDYDGDLNVVNAAINWFPWKHVGFEAGYSYTRYNLKVSRDNWHGEATYEFKGPTLSLVAAF